MLIAIFMISLCVIDLTLAGFRAAYGRDGRIEKSDLYNKAVGSGALAGMAVSAVMGALTWIVLAAVSNSAAVWADLVGIGARMLTVFGVFAVPVFVSLLVYAVSKHELRTLATVAILGPFTLARKAVIAVATLWGIAGSSTAAAALLTIGASSAVLYAERRLDRRFDPLVAWTHPSPDSGVKEEPAEADTPAVAKLSIEESIDLHFFAPRDIPSVVAEYLLEARKKGLVEVRLIHGRGKGVQRRVVQKILAKHPHVKSFRSDGLGSTLAELAVASRREKREKKKNGKA